MMVKPLRWVGGLCLATFACAPVLGSPCDPSLIGQLDATAFGTWSTNAPPVFDTQPGRDFAYAASSTPGQLFVIDLFGGAGPEITASVLLPFDRATGVASEDPATVVVCGYDSNSDVPGWIAQYDVSDPAAPILLGVVAAESTPRDLAVSNSIAIATLRTEPPLEEFEGVGFFSLTPTGPVSIESINVNDAGGRVELADTGGAADVLFTCHNDVITSIDYTNPAAPFLLATFDVGRTVSGFDVAGTTAYVGTGDCSSSTGSDCGVLTVNFGPQGDSPPAAPIVRVRTYNSTRVVCVTPQNAEVVMTDGASFLQVGAYVMDLTNSDLGPVYTGQTGAPFASGPVVLDGESGRIVMAERGGVARFYDVSACEFPPPQFRLGGTLILTGSSSYSLPNGNQIDLGPANASVKSGPSNHVAASGSTGSGGVRTNVSGLAEIVRLTRGVDEGVTTVNIKAMADSSSDCSSSGYFSSANADGSVELILSREYEVLDLSSYGSEDPDTSIMYSNLTRGVYPIGFVVEANFQSFNSYENIDWHLELQPVDADPAPAPRLRTGDEPVRFAVADTHGDGGSSIVVELYASTNGDYDSFYGTRSLTAEGLDEREDCASTKQYTSDVDYASTCGTSSASIEQVGDAYVVRIDLESDLSKTPTCLYDFEDGGCYFYGQSDENFSNTVIIELDQACRRLSESSSTSNGSDDFNLIDPQTGQGITGDILPAGWYGIEFSLEHEVSLDDIVSQSTNEFFRSYSYELNLLPIETAGFSNGVLGITGQASGNGISDSTFDSKDAEAKSASISGSTGSGGVRGNATTAAYVAEGDDTATVRVVGTAFATAEPGGNANIGIDNTNYNAPGNPDQPLQLQTYRPVNYQITDQSDGGTVTMRDAGNSIVPPSGMLSPGFYTLAVSMNAFADAGENDPYPDFQAGQLDWSLTMTMPRCAADLDGNGTLNIDDIALFAAAFLSGDLAADCDTSGVLNLDDVDCFATGFIEGCP